MSRWVPWKPWAHTVCDVTIAALVVSLTLSYDVGYNPFLGFSMTAALDSAGAVP